MFNSLSKFFYIVQGKRKSLLLLIALFWVVSFMEVASVGLVGPFISIATDPSFISRTPVFNLLYQRLGFESNSQLLFVFGLFLISIFFLKAFVSFSIQKFIFTFGFLLQGNLSFRLLHAYLAAPYTFHLSRNTAALIQSVLKDTEIFCNGVMMPLLTSISNVFVVVALTILLVATNAMGVAIISLLLLVAYFSTQFFKHKLIQWGKESSEARTEMVRIINHALGGFKETRVIGCEAFFEQQMQTQARSLAITASDANSFLSLPRYLIEVLLMTFLIGFTFFFLTFNHASSQSLTSVLGIFTLASVRLMPAVTNLLGTINGIRYNSYAVEKLYLDLHEQEVLENEKLKVQSSDSWDAETIYNQQKMSFSSDILLEDIIYRYPGIEDNALNRISLAVKRGQSIGLIGRSGAGKTTLVDVILGLLTPQSGDILVDGASIYKDLRSWQNLVGYVPQSIFLTDDTLERNVAFGVPDELINPEKLNAAIQAAQLSELVEQLPEGIKTVLGERGVRLSGGQRQRVGIARALYHEREVLVLDEATAALDNETERLVSEAIKSLSGSKTIIIIAHRLSTIEHCDRIYMLEKGRVVKFGTYKEVVSVQH